MKNIVLSISVLIISIALSSCGHKGDKTDPLYVQVMAIHDEVMPKMSTMHKLKKKLRKTSNPESKVVLELITQLDKADEGMMDWMANFDPPAEQPARKTYLEGQLQSVTTMAKAINQSIANAETYLAHEEQNTN